MNLRGRINKYTGGLTKGQVATVPVYQTRVESHKSTISKVLVMIYFLNSENFDPW